MSRRTRPLALFLLMLWLPALIMVAGRLSGCESFGPDTRQTDFHAPAMDAGFSAADAEGVVPIGTDI